MVCSIPVEVGKEFQMSEMVPVSGGYTCVADFDPDHIDLVKLVVTPGERMGAPARFTFTFVPRDAKTSIIHLIVVRPWAGGDVAKIVTCDIIPIKK
jgi:hypothetical protein